ncbi:hypothetical protein D9613_005172 [Agrocybe pediades]|uniref:Pre-rRNA-processing protein RIX1 N-terminal domain-containing protein n=1 Tax=Agrocybe pediades TaxID=84607 RepID=A0A8H4VTC2_9AGAR|nr:hypothetical protein D9613_005172 [Agrocybe pediades]
MEPGHHLKNLLQTQLASDASAIRHLPYCLSSLTAECFLPSSHLAKWSTRIHALIHSKESGARWAGLCLAYRTALLSQRIMIDLAQSWITAVLPMLSRKEPVPVLKAAIRLLRTIFTTATDIPEFQRQVSVPNVVKFTSLVMSVADNVDIELKVMSLQALASVIATYPSAHRASSASLSAFVLQYLSGSTMGPTDQELLHAAARLKRDQLVEKIARRDIGLWVGRVAFLTYHLSNEQYDFVFFVTSPVSLSSDDTVQNNVQPVPIPEPQVAIPLNHDRLRCSVVIIRYLLGTVIQRPVQVPLGGLIKYVLGLLSCSTDGKIDGFVDPSIRSMEESIVPEIRKLGCDLLVAVAEQFPYRLDPYVGRLCTLLAIQLEQNQRPTERLHCLKAVDTLLKTCRPVESPVIPTRLSKAVLPSLTRILSASTTNIDSEPSSSKSKNAKKRARNYEGDEVFKMTRQVTYATAEESEVALISLDVAHVLLLNSNLSPTMQSIIARLMISLLMTLPRLPWHSLSQDPTLVQRLIKKVQNIGFTISSGTTGVMSKSLPFVIKASLRSDELESQRNLGILIHPRVPPLVRSMPHIESLSLYKAEESQEEAEALRALKIADMHIHQTPEVEDIVMTDHNSTLTKQTSNTGPEPVLSQSYALAEVSREPAKVPLSKAQTETLIEPAGTSKPLLENKSYKTDRPQTTVHNVHTTSIAQDIKTPITTPFRPTAIPVPAQEDDNEDEEMPSIDLDSDSEVDED